ncbi:MAG: hypothetical protein M1840_006846 [Geoglossum simile]|nr:MAG: hypothetical protein M1840_006846 [Geoglossum simile]
MASTNEDVVEGSSDPTSALDIHRVRITYAHPGSVPPVYLAGSFTALPWEPQEMQYTELQSKEAESGEGGQQAQLEYEFYKELDVKEGQWQYRFRVGQGDLWVLDGNTPTVVGRGGCRNNYLVVRRDSASHALERAPSSGITTAEPETAPSETPVAQLSTAHGGFEGYPAGEAVGVMESPDLPISVKPDTDEPVKLGDLPVKLSEPDIIPPQEEVTVLKERDKAIPQDVEDKTNLVLPGHENKGGELVGVQERGLAPNGPHYTVLDASESPELCEASRGSNGDCPIEHTEEVPLEVGEQAEQRTTKSPLKPSFTEQKGSVSSSSYEVFPVRPVEENVNEFTEVFNSSDEHIQDGPPTKEPSSIKTPDFVEEVPIPFTVVEKAPDKEPPTYGEDIGDNGSLREGVEDRQADVEPDQVIESEKSQLNEVLEDTNEPISVPLLVVDKTDDKPSYGDDFGAEGSHAQKLAHGKRAADAEPDEIRISPEERAPAGVVVEGDEHPPTAEPEKSLHVEGLQEVVEVSGMGELAEIEKAPAPSEAVERAEPTESMEALEAVETLKSELDLESERATEAADITEKVETLEAAESAEPEEGPGELETLEVAESSEELMVPVESTEQKEILTTEPKEMLATGPEEVLAVKPEGILAATEAPEAIAVPEATAVPEVEETTAPAESVETPGAEEITIIADAPVVEEAPELERASELEEVTVTAGELEVVNATEPKEAPKAETVVEATEQETSGTKEAAEVADVPEISGVDETTVTGSQANHISEESSVVAESATSLVVEAETIHGVDDADCTITKQHDKEWNLKMHEESEQAIPEHAGDDEGLIRDASRPSGNEVLSASARDASQVNDRPDPVEADRAEDVVTRADEDLEPPTSFGTTEIPEVAMEAPLGNHSPTEAAPPVVLAEQGPAAEDILKDEVFIAPSLPEVNESGTHVDLTGVREESLGTNELDEEGAETPKASDVLIDTNRAKVGSLTVGHEIPDKSPDMKTSKEEDRARDHDIVDESHEPELTKEKGCEVPESANRPPEADIPKEDLNRALYTSETPKTHSVEEGNLDGIREVIKEPSEETHQDPWATVGHEVDHTQGVEDELLNQVKHEAEHGGEHGEKYEEGQQEKQEERQEERHEKHEEKLEEKHEENHEKGPEEMHEEEHEEEHGEKYEGNHEEELEGGHEEPTPATSATLVEPAQAAVPRDPIVPVLDPHTTTTNAAGNATRLDGPEGSSSRLPLVREPVLDLKIGETKPLSLTPDVASAAIEAANLANTDGKDEYTSQPGLSFSKFAAAVGHNHETDSPRIEDAPLFAHECLTPCEERPVGPKHQLRNSLVGSDSPPEPEEPSAVDLEDPLLEAFPSDREHIIERLRTTESRLEEDETLVEGIPPSPVLNTSNQPSDAAARRSPSPLIERSPNLDAIPEEDAPSSAPQVHTLPEAASVGLESREDQIISIPATGTSAVLASAMAAVIASQREESPGEGTSQEERVDSPPSTLLPGADPDPAHQLPDIEADQSVNASPNASKTDRDTPPSQASISPEGNTLPTGVSAEPLLSSLEIPEAAKPPTEAEPEPAEKIDISCGLKSQQKPGLEPSDHGTTLGESSGEFGPSFMGYTSPPIISTVAPTSSSIVLAEDAGMEQHSPVSGVSEVLRDGQNETHLLAEASASPDTVREKAAAEGVPKNQASSLESPAYGGIVQADIGAGAFEGSALSTITPTGKMQPPNGVSPNVPQVIRGGIHVPDEASAKAEAAGDNVSTDGEESLEQEVSVSSTKDTDNALSTGIDTRGTAAKVITGTVIGTAIIIGGAVSTLEANEAPDDLHNTTRSSTRKGPGAEPQLSTRDSAMAEPTQEQDEDATEGAVASKATGESRTKAPPPEITITSEPAGAEGGTAQTKLIGVSSVGDGALEGGLRQRKAATDASDRPRTPHSIQSTKAQKHSNIFKTFWRTVFGGWIGGFFSKIFSKKQRRT